MANTGKICILFNPCLKIGIVWDVKRSWNSFIQDHGALKNHEVICDYNGGSYLAEVDNLQPLNVANFMRTLKPEVLANTKFFCVNMVYGDEWEEVKL